MKKSVLLLVTIVMMTMVTFTECKPKEEAPKNYYGVHNNDTEANADAYKAFGATILVLAVLTIWGIKRLKKKK